MSVESDVPSTSKPSGLDTLQPTTYAQASKAAPAPLAGRVVVEWPLTSMASNPHNVACIAFVLGAIFSLGLGNAASLLTSKHLIWTPTTYVAKLAPQGLVQAIKSPLLGLYLACWATFHLLEFVVTSMWNPSKLSVSSYLLDNGAAYHIAHVFGILEYILEEAYLPAEWRQYKHAGAVVILGIGMVLVGQVLRSYAMYSAASNFSHIIAHSKLPTHQLVTTGIYSWSRHPSYAGFFWWALGTQVVLGNPIGILAFALALHTFFSNRIKVEEPLLIKFFGKEYIKYREAVPTRIPFV